MSLKKSLNSLFFVYFCQKKWNQISNGCFCVFERLKKVFFTYSRCSLTAPCGAAQFIYLLFLHRSFSLPMSNIAIVGRLLSNNHIQTGFNIAAFSLEITGVGCKSIPGTFILPPPRDAHTWYDWDVCFCTFNTHTCLLLHSNRRKRQRSYVANIPDLTSEVKVKPCLFQSGNRCHAKENSTVWNVHVHMCFEKLLLAACITNQLPQGCPAFFFIVPVRSAICSIGWNCNKQGFTVCPHLASARREHILLIAQVFDDKNYWRSCLFWQTTLFCGTRCWCHQTALCHLLVTDTIYSTFICLLLHYLMPVVHLCNTSHSWASTWVHLNCYDPLYC